MDGVFYWAAIGLLVLIAFIAIRTQVALFFARSATARVRRYPLDVYEAAYLAGGPRRVVNTALVSLLSQDGVRVSSEGVVTPVQGFKPNKHVPVERAVYRHVASVPGGRTTAEVRHSAGGDHALRRLSTPLWRQGLLMSPAARVRTRRRTSWLFVFTGLAVVVALLSPFLRGPLDTLVIAAGAAVAGVLFFWWLRRSMANPLTKAGRTALTKAGAQDTADGSWMGSDDVALVALHGLTKLPDRRLADTLRRDTRARNNLRVAACCTPGHCGSYGGGASFPLVYDSGTNGGGGDSGGFFDFSGMFDFAGGGGGGGGP
jgi:uncharacterized protein (TIGR04222 family)